MLTATAPGTLAEDWPQWRGPNRDGKSAETGLLKRWPQGGPPLAWVNKEVGAGYGAPSVADGKVFVMGNGKKKEWVVCLDEQSGEQIWACTTGLIRSKGGGYPGPRSTPTFVDGKLYAMGLAGRVVCCDADSGKPIWFREMMRDFGGKEPECGYSESVLVDRGRVICTPGMEKTVVALDAKTGKEIWAAKAGDPAAYSSIVKAVFEETAQYVAFTHRGLIGIRAADGAVLWRYDAPSNGQANCPTPVVVGKTVFAASGYGKGGGCVWIRKDESGEFSPKEMYFTNRMQNQYGGFVVDDGYLYGCSDPGVLVCLNYKTGKVAKAVRTGRCSISYAEGMLYVRGEDFQVDLYKASSTKLTRHGTFQQPHRSKSKAWPPPVIANGRMYLRDQYVLLCYDIAAKTAKKAKEAREAKKTKGKEAEKAKVKADEKARSKKGESSSDGDESKAPEKTPPRRKRGEFKRR